MTQKYRNDFSRCNGAGCNKKDKCGRFEAHKEAVTLKLGRCIYIESHNCTGMYYCNFVEMK